jgi:hypothetical protein
MTPQDGDLLTSLFDRLKPVERNPKDEEHRPGRGGAAVGAVLHGAVPADAGSGVTPGRNCDLRPRVVL